MTRHAPQPPAPRLSDQEAERIWRRAAELQAAAARLAELRAREVGGGAGTGPDEDGGPSDGYSLAEVRDAAVEAGIPPALIEQALLEVEADRAARHRGHEVPAAAGRLLGETPESVEVSRVLPADRQAVLAALAELVPNAPYHLRLVEVVGPAPTDGGLLVFELRGAQDLIALGAGSFSSFSLAMQTADLRRFVFRLVPAGDGSATEVSVRSPLDYSKRLNTWVGGGIVVGGGALSGLAGGAAGAALLGGLATAGPALAVGAGLAAAAGGAGLLVRGYRRLYRWALRKGERGLEELLRDLETRLRTADAFAAFLPSASPAQPGDDGTRALLARLTRRSAQ